MHWSVLAEETDLFVVLLLDLFIVHVVYALFMLLTLAIDNALEGMTDLLSASLHVLYYIIAV